MQRLRCSSLCLVLLCCPAFGQSPDCNAGHSEAKKLEARAALNAGVEDFRNARYDDAIVKFQSAVNLDPCLRNAKAYLGTALAQEVVPGAETPENLKTAQRAIAVFKEVLQSNPHDIPSMKAVASVDFHIGKLEDARDWQRQVMTEDPSDAEAAYTIGVIDWTLAHQHVLQALQAAGLSDDGNGNRSAPPGVLMEIQSENAELVREALEYLKRAIENRPNYADAMVYLNLVYREKADVDWSDPAARTEDLAEADAWTKKALEIRKASTAARTPGPGPTNP